MTRFEVLLRLRLADGTLVKPKESLGRAAQQRLLPGIDRWVVKTLLQWLAKNRSYWTRIPSVVSVNLTAQSITDLGFVSFLESSVLKSGLPPQAPCFDITERYAASGNISVAEALRRLEALGCDVAMDVSARIPRPTATCARCRRTTLRSTHRWWELRRRTESPVP